MTYGLSILYSILYNHHSVFISTNSFQPLPFNYYVSGAIQVPEGIEMNKTKTLCSKLNWYHL